MAPPSNHVFHDYNILNVFLYKTLLGKKKRRGGWDEV
jgi:hypothetical protein